MNRADGYHLSWQKAEGGTAAQLSMPFEGMEPIESRVTCW
jgi:hypothetical protein